MKNRTLKKGNRKSMKGGFWGSNSDSTVKRSWSEFLFGPKQPVAPVAPVAPVINDDMNKDANAAIITQQMGGKKKTQKKTKKIRSCKKN